MVGLSTIKRRIQRRTLTPPPPDEQIQKKVSSWLRLICCSTLPGTKPSKPAAHFTSPSTRQRGPRRRDITGIVITVFLIHAGDVRDEDYGVYCAARFCEQVCCCCFYDERSDVARYPKKHYWISCSGRWKAAGGGSIRSGHVFTCYVTF